MMDDPLAMPKTNLHRHNGRNVMIQVTLATRRVVTNLPMGELAIPYIRLMHGLNTNSAQIINKIGSNLKCEERQCH